MLFSPIWIAEEVQPGTMLCPGSHSHIVSCSLTSLESIAPELSQRDVYLARIWLHSIQIALQDLPAFIRRRP